MMSEELEHLKVQNRQMEAWIRQAAPMLSRAACIVIDESPKRLDEIAGVRGVLELCPVDFTEEEER